MLRKNLLFVFCLLVSNVVLADWQDTFSMKGDIRLRFEGIEDETKAKAGSQEDSRWRKRIRTRLEIKAKVSDDIDAIIRMATGQNTGGKITSAIGSTNEGYDNYGANKEFNLDQAYITWKLLDGDLKLMGGKMKNSLYRAGGSDILWDGDFTPEGVQITYKRDIDSWNMFSNVVGYMLDEDSKGQEMGLLGLQAGVSFDSSFKFTFGAGFYSINSENLEAAVNKGNATKVVAVGANSTNFFVNDYEMLEGFLTVSGDVMDEPLMLYSNYVNNIATDDDNKAFIIGIRYGNKPKEVGNFRLDFHYERLEKEAIFGLINDSDFNGGVTGGEGYVYTVWYEIAKNTTVRFRHFDSEQDLTTSSEERYKRYIADISFKF